jgi:mannose-6-phosphate isomerase-like protein (cupin superfamily)
MAGVQHRRHEFSAAERKTLFELRRAVFASRPLQPGEIIRAGDIFLSIPGVPGQLTANDLSKYNEYRVTRACAVGEPVLFSGVSVTDTRSLLHGIVRDVKALLKASAAIVPTQLELEVSHHYGLERFRAFGSTTITVVNRDAYCKRVILMLAGQAHPEQWHELKDETYHLLHGEIELVLDGQRRMCVKNDVVIIPRGVRHEFRSATGAVIEEISSAYEQRDSYYSDPAIRDNENRKTYVTNWMD